MATMIFLMIVYLVAIVSATSPTELIPLETSASTSDASTSTSSVSIASSTSSTSPESSATASSATPSPSLTNLLGPNDTPTVDHVADSMNVANDSKNGFPIFRAAVTVILALTKCSPGGLWIKSMFKTTNSQHLINQGGNYTRAMLFSNETSNQTDGTGWKRWTKDLDRSKLVDVELKVFDRDPTGPNYDNPWWPWALIDGALEAGWAPGTTNVTDYRWDQLFHILTGVEVDLIDTSEVHREILWNDYFIKADYTPILIEWENAWSVVMSTDDREGAQWWPWALIDGALEAGWAPGTTNVTDYRWDQLFHILTGVEVDLIDTSEVHREILWNDYFIKADYTPILIEWENAWSVVMSTDDREGAQWLGWADPYPVHVARKNGINDQQDGRLTWFTRYEAFPNVTKVMHLKDFAAFDVNEVRDYD